MEPDAFTERLTVIRKRFASTVEGKIAKAREALPQAVGDDAMAVEKAAAAYQQIHRICGVASTVGFTATGTAARSAEDVLVQAFRSKRGLSLSEAQFVQQALESLRTTAQSELETMKCGGE